MGLFKSSLNKLIAGIAVAVLGTMAAKVGCQPGDVSRILQNVGSEQPNWIPGSSEPQPGDGYGQGTDPSDVHNGNVAQGGYGSGNQVPGQQVGYGQSVQPSDSLVIGSFNIQAFGRSKMSKPHLVNVLVDVVRRFDIIAIQELRDKDQQTIPAFLQALNQGGYNYAAAVSRRVGYTDHRSGRAYEEQMVYLYDTSRVEIISRPYVAQDRYSIMHRPPYVAHFRCRGLPSEQAFSFVLMNVHTDPDDTEVEFDALQEIIGMTFPNHPGEDDFMLLGDLNDEASGFQHVRWFANQFPAIPSHWKTNTRMSKSYDNIVFDSRRTAEFTNQAGVMNLLQEYGLTEKQALQVSDHMPVWAVFSTREHRGATMTQDPRMVR